MTEISRPWAGTSVGDAGPYSAANWWDVWQAMVGSHGMVGGAGNKGVLSNVPGGLKVTYTAPNTVSVAAGAAMIDGLYYRNDVAKSVTVPSATAGNIRDDRVVVRKYFSAATQNARIALLTGTPAATPGPGTPPALTQDTLRSTYWDIPLARVSITELGVVTVTDERAFITGDAVVKITETVIPPGGAEVSWLDIPQQFKHLRIVYAARCTENGNLSDQVLVQFNGDTGANYNGAYAEQFTGSDLWLKTAVPENMMYTGPMPSALDTALYPGVGEIIIHDYTNPVWYKSLTFHGWQYGASFVVDEVGGGLWMSAAPITSIRLYADSDHDDFPNFAEGSVFTLYGMP